MRHINKGDQFVVACVESPDTAPAVIAAAQLFATHLRHKSLMLLNVAPSGSDSEWLKQYGLPYAALHGDWATAIEGLPTVFNAVLAVAAVDPAAPRSSFANPRTLLREFRKCKVAYLAVPASGATVVKTGVSAVVTVDFHRESKEKLIWASYLSRFVGAELTIALPQYKDQGLRTLQDNNLRFIDKVFTPLDIRYGKRSLRASHTPDLEALDNLRPDLLVALATDPRATDPIDWILGTTDRRLLTHPSATPILFLNPRDDLYVLCD